MDVVWRLGVRNSLFPRSVYFLDMHLRAVLVLDRCILHLLGHIVEHRGHHVLQLVTTDIDQGHQETQQDHTKHNKQEDQRCRVATDVWLQLPIELLIFGDIKE